MRGPSAPAPARGTPPAASVVVRPDVLEVDFALRIVVDDPDVGVRTLAETTKTIEARFGEVVPKGALTLRMRAMNVEPVHASGKAKRDSAEPAPVTVTADGRLVVALAPSQDYWERSHLAARMKAAADRLAVHSVVGFGHIEPHVRSPEAVRAELAQRWASHRKQSAREVQAGDGVLAREVCAPAARVVERIVSFEEIELTLPIECRRLE